MKKLVVLIVLLLLFVPVLTSTAALADPIGGSGYTWSPPGCPKAYKWRTVRLGWTHNDTMSIPTIVPGGIKQRGIEVKMTAMLTYWQCATNYRKVKPFSQRFCWQQLDDENHSVFDGVEMNSYIWDSDGMSIDPGPKLVPDKKASWNCKDFDIPAKDQEWMLQRSTPKYKVKYEIIRKGPLTNYIDLFTAEYDGSKSFRYIEPFRDYKVTGWKNVKKK